MKRWTGIINSPGYELGIYDNSQDCTWEIKTAWGNQVKVTFHEFDLEESRAPNGTKVCTDYVQVSNGCVKAIKSTATEGNMYSS